MHNPLDSYWAEEIDFENGRIPNFGSGHMSHGRIALTDLYLAAMYQIAF